MPIRLPLATLLLLTVLLAPSVPVAGASARQATVTAHGVRLALAIPRRSYPRDALIAVRVSLTNVSRRTIWEAPMVVGFCSQVDFTVNVLDGAGHALSPLPPAPGPYPPCPAPLPYPLHPGQTVSQRIEVVLLGSRLQATANVNTVSATRNYRGTDLTTPALAVHLSPAASPTVSVQAGGSTDTAVVAKPAGANGPMRYQQWADCPGSVTRVLTWTAAPGNTVTAGCAHPRAWHLVAGWLGHPAAFLDVVSPPPSPAVEVAPPFSSAPYSLRVGDVLEVKVLLFGPGVDVASSDPAYLRLVAASAQSAEPVRYDWRWQAVGAGETGIIISPQGPARQPYVLRVHIVP